MTFNSYNYAMEAMDRVVCELERKGATIIAATASAAHPGVTARVHIKAPPEAWADTRTVDLRDGPDDELSHPYQHSVDRLGVTVFWLTDTP